MPPEFGRLGGWERTVVEEQALGRVAVVTGASLVVDGGWSVAKDSA
jgi:hypothetical protein